MGKSETTTGPEAPPARPGAGAVDALARAVATEARLLEDLIAVLRRQRDAVAAEDYQAVDDSVFATHRILVTLGEAARRRRSVGRLLGGMEELSVREMEARLGDRVTEELRSAWRGRDAAAATLAEEVERNRHTLRGALAAGSVMPAA